ncbi:uncharacterized protein Dana_GF16360, isoform G [Drosophila ananassae]|uniref:Uncharacterized protein, isoform G n=3 Tax=Drosophila ananassae TaxID=7217 RepID=A0A0P9AAN2_DROAN|nr:NHL repeat-containing protein 2 isoform X1 [Drosophila ananassae]KPU75339.1 uncharacterized protein Dana_GF16360, isoform G [Drosophila ananassae]
MDSNDDLPIVDVLTFITDELLHTYRSCVGEKDKEKSIIEFLERLDDDKSILKLKTINIEIKSDLDWFNVSRPLTISELRGKIVILDFFTYCCINCMHVLPELHSIQDSFPPESGLVIIGVHSPKFENERANSNILSAVLRYGVTHPIVNDFGSTLWQSLSIRCWPTLIVLSPAGLPLLLLMGEGNGKFLENFISVALSFFGRQGKLEHYNLPLQLSTNPNPASKLRFPAKIARSPAGRFAISDAGNNRVLVVSSRGLVEHIIGDHKAGLIDGKFTEARFKHPQGLTFLDEHTLIVADTENHALRKISLADGIVKTLAGTGVQGCDRIGGNAGPVQPISSPWDVAIFRTRDMDMSFHLDERNVLEKTIVLISMAGTHQIWGYFPEGIIWWKFRKFDPLCCVSLIGNGLEENRNNSYPQNAAFAQPSGLAMSKDFLFVADSESSSIRKVSLVDGKVMPVVGGDRNPLNLFAFGDVDGKLYNAKLQHPLGVACHTTESKIFVTDTYNHKIKVIDTDENYVSTMAIVNEDGSPIVFNEPTGLCLDADGCNLLVADTNNHTIYIIDLLTLKAKPFCLDFSQVTERESNEPQYSFINRELVHKTLSLHCSEINTIIFNILLLLPLKFTEEAPQKWIVQKLSQSVNVTHSSGTLDNGTCNIQVQNKNLNSEDITNQIVIEFLLNLCEVKFCLIKRFLVTIDIKFNEKVCENRHDVNIQIDRSNIHIE